VKETHIKEILNLLSNGGVMFRCTSTKRPWE